MYVLICYNLVILLDNINLVTTEFDKILAVVPPRSSGARGREQQIFFVIRVVRPSYPLSWDYCICVFDTCIKIKPLKAIAPPLHRPP